MNKKRYDRTGNLLYVGESQMKDGRYRYRWQVNGEQKTVYGLTLAELREKEEQICSSTYRYDNVSDEFIDILYAVANDYNRKMNFELANELRICKDFIQFFKEELPQVYKRLKKEFREVTDDEQQLF